LLLQGIHFEFGFWHMAAGQNVQTQSLEGLFRDGAAGGYFLHDLQIVHKNNCGRTRANPNQMGE
jgi:hypothetical protein